MRGDRTDEDVGLRLDADGRDVGIERGGPGTDRDEQHRCDDQEDHADRDQF
jgi:hypothetical protein